ncbi:MAG TPA: hypothetical protein VEF72_19030 [Mycobacterium sp.]|nr:hypothetical protein [Mycobacterium sp.]
MGSSSAIRKEFARRVGRQTRRLTAPIEKHRGAIVETTPYALRRDLRWWDPDADSYDPTRPVEPDYVESAHGTDRRTTDGVRERFGKRHFLRDTLASEITNTVNTFSSVLANDYAVLLPMADLALALGITFPTYDASLFVTRLEAGHLLNAVGDPIAADLGLVTFGGFLELLAVELAVETTISNLVGPGLLIRKRR